MMEEWIHKLADLALMYASIVDKLMNAREDRDQQWFIDWQDNLNEISVR